MPIYTYANARQNLAELLNEAKKNNEVIIKTKEGDSFTLRIVHKKNLSDLPDTGVALTRDEIISYIREIRER